MLALIVDDDFDMREIVKEALSDNYDSVNFLEATDSHEAIFLYEKFGDRIDLIICDYNMPEGNGDILFDYWKDHAYHIPFILLSKEVLKAREAFSEISDIDFERLGFVEKSQGTAALVCEVERLSEKAFVSLPTFIVSSARPLAAPLYIAVNNKKMVKLCHEGDSLDEQKVDSYSDKGVEKFYVPFSIAREKGIQFPFLSVHNPPTQNLTLESLFENFKNIHVELLKPYIQKETRLDFSLDELSRNLTKKLPRETLFSFFKEKGFFQRDYVVNHTLLVATIALMGLDELGIANESSRQSLVQGILLHDILKTDQEAMDFDLMTNKKAGLTDRVGRSKYLFKMMDLLKKYQLGSDVETIVETLILGIREPNYGPRGNHKLSSLALAAHRICNDLYVSSFTKEFKKSDFKSYSSQDSQVISALEAILKF